MWKTIQYEDQIMTNRLCEEMFLAVWDILNFIVFWYFVVSSHWTLTQLGIDNKGKPDNASSKRKLIRWIQKTYKDIMENVDKEPEDRKTTLEELLLFNGEVWR